MGPEVMAMMALASMVASVGGTLMAGKAAKDEGKARNAMAQREAEQMEINAGQERATSQREAYELGRQRDLKMSEATASAASSGTGTLDVSIIDIMGDLESEGRYNQDVARFEGESRARDLTGQADISRYEGKLAENAGKVKQKASFFKAGSKVAAYGGSKSAKTLYDKYK